MTRLLECNIKLRCHGVSEKMVLIIQVCLILLATLITKCQQTLSANTTGLQNITSYRNHNIEAEGHSNDVKLHTLLEMNHIYDTIYNTNSSKIPMLNRNVNTSTKRDHQSGEFEVPRPLLNCLQSSFTNVNKTSVKEVEMSNSDGDNNNGTRTNCKHIEEETAIDMLDSTFLGDQEKRDLEEVPVPKNRMHHTILSTMDENEEDDYRSINETTVKERSIDTRSKSGQKSVSFHIKRFTNQDEQEGCFSNNDRWNQKTCYALRCVDGGILYKVTRGRQVVINSLVIRGYTSKTKCFEVQPKTKEEIVCFGWVKMTWKKNIFDGCLKTDVSQANDRNYYTDLQCIKINCKDYNWNLKKEKEKTVKKNQPSYSPTEQKPPRQNNHASYKPSTANMHSHGVVSSQRPQTGQGTQNYPSYPSNQKPQTGHGQGTQNYPIFPSNQIPQTGQGTQNYPSYPSNQRPQTAQGTHNYPSYPSNQRPQTGQGTHNYPSYPSNQRPQTGQGTQNYPSYPSNQRPQTGQGTQNYPSYPSNQRPQTGQGTQNYPSYPSNQRPQTAQGTQNYPSYPSNQRPQTGQGTQNYPSYPSNQRPQTAQGTQNYPSYPSNQRPQTGQGTQNYPSYLSNLRPETMQGSLGYQPHHQSPVLPKPFDQIPSHTTPLDPNQLQLTCPLIKKPDRFQKELKVVCRLVPVTEKGQHSGSLPFEVLQRSLNEQQMRLECPTVTNPTSLSNSEIECRLLVLAS